MQRAFSWKNPKPEKTAAVIRYGAWGDMLQSMSILPGLKREGYDITVFCTPRGVEVIRNDPHIDRLVIQDEDMVPNAELMAYFDYLKTKYTKVINLCETVEGVVLPMSYRAHFHWPKEARHAICNRNYVELQHMIAGVPYSGPETRFYASDEEKAWARKEVDSLGKGPVIAWSLSGSAFHKIWPYVDSAVAALLGIYPNARVVLLGGKAEEQLVGKILDRVISKVGQWNIRESIAFAQQSDMVIGPETGVLNAVAMESMPKVVLLSHSTVENLTRDWVNTISLAPEGADCYPCHRLQLDGWKYCNRHPEGNAVCQRMITPEMMIKAVVKGFNGLAN